VTHPCLPVTPADRPAGGVTAPSRLTRVVNGGWLPQGRRSEQHTGTTPTTTDRNGELFIPGPARLISQSPPEINDDWQPGTTVPAVTAVARRRGRRRALSDQAIARQLRALGAGSRVPPASSRPTAPAMTPATGSPPATTMPSSPRPAARRHSGVSRDIARRAPAPASRPGAVRRAWPRRLGDFSAKAGERDAGRNCMRGSNSQKRPRRHQTGRGDPFSLPLRGPPAPDRQSGRDPGVIRSFGGF